MPSFIPNPEAEASASFDTVKPGTYAMRIKDVTEFVAKSGNTCWRVQSEYIDPSNLEKLDGGMAANPGTLLDSGFVVSDPSKQGKLRSLWEACALDWADAGDSDLLVGAELDIKVGLEEYQGETKNVAKRYLAPQSQVA